MFVWLCFCDAGMDFNYLCCSFIWKKPMSRYLHSVCRDDKIKQLSTGPSCQSTQYITDWCVWGWYVNYMGGTDKRFHARRCNLEQRVYFVPLNISCMLTFLLCHCTLVFALQTITLQVHSDHTGPKSINQAQLAVYTVVAQTKWENVSPGSTKAIKTNFLNRK